MNEIENSVTINIEALIIKNIICFQFIKNNLIGSIMLFASNQYLALKSFKRLDICIKNIVDVLI